MKSKLVQLSVAIGMMSVSALVLAAGNCCDGSACCLEMLACCL